MKTAAQPMAHTIANQRVIGTRKSGSLEMLMILVSFPGDDRPGLLADRSSPMIMAFTFQSRWSSSRSRLNAADERASDLQRFKFDNPPV